MLCLDMPSQLNSSATFYFQTQCSPMLLVEYVWQKTLVPLLDSVCLFTLAWTRLSRRQLVEALYWTDSQNVLPSRFSSLMSIVTSWPSLHHVICLLALRGSLMWFTPNEALHSAPCLVSLETSLSLSHCDGAEKDILPALGEVIP